MQFSLFSVFHILFIDHSLVCSPGSRQIGHRISGLLFLMIAGSQKCFSKCHDEMTDSEEANLREGVYLKI